MIRFILRRLLKMVPILLGITILTFLLTRLSPGDPAHNALGIYATPERIAVYRAEFGLDKPLLDQYLIYLANVFQGDLGFSYFYRQPALDLILARLGPGLVLITYAIVL